jgi:uncharacterized protein (TIGR03067 family)
MTVPMLVVLAAGLMTGAVPLPAEEDAGKKDLKAMAGTWKPTKAVRRGQPAPAEALEQLTLVIKDNTITVKEGPREEEATFTIDASKKPRQFDLTPKKEGRDRGKVLGIYEIKGDTLKMAWIKGGKERPKEFTSPEGSQVFLIELKRTKK